MILGIDVGGTKIAVGLVTASGVVKSYTTHPTESSGGRAHVLKNIKNAIQNHLTKNVDVIGIGIAGQVDNKHGVFREGPHLPKDFKNVPLVKILKKEFGLQVFIDNDAHCFTLAEAAHGAGKKYHQVFGVTLGTGIGGGMTIDKKLIHGADNSAWEVGHMRIAFPCALSLGKYSSGTNLARRYKELTQKNVTAQELESLYKKGDTHAKKVIKDGARALAIGLTNVLIVANPDCIVLGGGLARFNKYVSRALHDIPELLPFPHLKKTPILHAKLGQQAGLIGAALLAQQNRER